MKYLKTVLLLVLSNTLSAYVLEEDIQPADLAGKKIGYYIGSFDPVHLGHIGVIDKVLKENLVDYVLVYPVPGADNFKNRTDSAIRQKMLRSVFRRHPQVILSDRPPLELQKTFSPYLGKMEIIGVIGSDVVTEHFFSSDKTFREKYQKIFMRGLDISPKHAEDAIGALMALPASSFIVSLRQGTDLSHLDNKLGDRPIKAFVTLDPPYSFLSSTKVREAVREGRSIEQMVPPDVKEVIEDCSLYLH